MTTPATTETTMTKQAGLALGTLNFYATSAATSGDERRQVEEALSTIRAALAARDAELALLRATPTAQEREDAAAEFDKRSEAQANNLYDYLDDA
jgi:hypothetical protein